MADQTENDTTTTTTGTLPLWAWISIGVVASLLVIISIYFTFIKYRTLAKDPKELSKYLIAKEASNAAVNIFGNRQPSQPFSSRSRF